MCRLIPPIMYIFTSSTIDEVRSTVASWFTAANYNVDQDLFNRPGDSSERVHADTNVIAYVGLLASVRSPSLDRSG